VTAELDVAFGDTEDTPGRVEPPNHLLDNRWQEIRVGAHLLEDVRVFAQCRERETDCALSGFEATSGQLSDDPEDLLFVETALALALGGLDEAADDVVAGVGSALLDCCAHIAVQLDLLQGELVATLSRERRDEEFESAQNPALEPGVICVGETEDIRHHGDRQRQRETFDDICVSVGNERVDQPIGDVADHSLVLSDGLGRQCFLGQLTNAGVDGRVGVVEGGKTQRVAMRQLGCKISRNRAHHVVRQVTESLMIAQGDDDIVVAANGPHVEGWDVDNRFVIPEQAEYVSHVPGRSGECLPQRRLGRIQRRRSFLSGHRTPLRWA